jgi:antitoxin component of MazEF toxin-antitoxin module
MLKTITKIGNSQGLILDAALCELAGLKAGDEVNVTVHEGGAMTITPIRRAASPAVVSAAIRKTVKDYRKTLRRLA